MTYTLTLEQSDVQLLMHALGELPLKATLNTFAKLQKQVAEQDAANAIEVAHVGK
jgi:hypothetical protein